mmetsp:Transcript_31785/g.92062  ORF Transcript_31785/g.92062 Transcript_31785/m.92062 type:complete len:419 (-) Transcript_31785:929-2185(-)
MQKIQFSLPTGESRQLQVVTLMDGSLLPPYAVAGSAGPTVGVHRFGRCIRGDILHLPFLGGPWLILRLLVLLSIPLLASPLTLTLTSAFLLDLCCAVLPRLPARCHFLFFGLHLVGCRLFECCCLSFLDLLAAHLFVFEGSLILNGKLNYGTLLLGEHGGVVVEVAEGCQRHAMPPEVNKRKTLRSSHFLLPQRPDIGLAVLVSDQLDPLDGRRRFLLERLVILQADRVDQSRLWLVPLRWRCPESCLAPVVTGQEGCDGRSQPIGVDRQGQIANRQAEWVDGIVWVFQFDFFLRPCGLATLHVALGHVFGILGVGHDIPLLGQAHQPILGLTKSSSLLSMRVQRLHFSRGDRFEAVYPSAPQVDAQPLQRQKGASLHIHTAISPLAARGRLVLFPLGRLRVLELAVRLLLDGQDAIG